MELIERFSTKNDCYQNNLKKLDSRYTQFQSRGPQGLMLHSVGTPQPSAAVFADSWNTAGKEVAVHAVLQADGIVYQCLPWNYRGWHAGGSANDSFVGIEMTEPAEIRYTGGSTFTVLDAEKAKAQCRGTYRTAVELFAALCEDYHLDPKTAIISHAEGNARGIASNHADPEHLWKGLGLEYSMDTFRKDVAALLDTPIYRVRKTWADTKGQLGAFHSLENAKAACPPGYSVFDREGKAVYTAPNETTAPITREQLLSLLGDTYIETFDQLPDWAKPEMREILDRGFINGGTADQPDDINMLLSDIRIAIVAYRTQKLMQSEAE